MASRPYQCDVCYLDFWSSQALQRHLTWSPAHVWDSGVGDGANVCLHCGWRFLSPDDLAEHQLSAGSAFQCDICDEWTTCAHRVDEPDMIVDIVDAGDPLPTDVWPVGGDTDMDYDDDNDDDDDDDDDDDEITSEAYASDDMFRCETCGETFSTQTYLMWHDLSCEERREASIPPSASLVEQYERIVEVSGSRSRASASSLHCLICMDDNRCIVYRPCMHLVACVACAFDCLLKPTRLAQSYSCPLCRTPVDTIERIFV
ncbi:hypothetical protein PBRA_000742 [Plasmodiophora brassicae]|uniref:RING-type domain-containing protein n=1 Tax=Plasmodiophora brassicae TaxID=37360 RepID=A0A0G4IQI9_PLABS|nr:hypothetical protein PBRA_000742 [Plasmodiophora brassicae]